MMREDVGLVDGALALQHARDALEAGAGVDVLAAAAAVREPSLGR